MSLQANSNVDKTIVERRAPHAGSMSRAAVQSIRAEIGKHNTQSRRKNIDFNKDVLQRHGREQYFAAIAFSGTALVAGILSQFNLGMIVTSIWFVFAVAIAFANHTYGEKIHKDAPESIDQKLVQNIFSVLTAMSGIVWSALFLLHTMSASGEAFLTLVFCAAILTVSLFYVSSRYLPFGILFGGLPTTLVVLYAMVTTMSMVSAALAVLLVVALGFCQYLGAGARKGYSSYLHSKAERDQLIVELEASRGVSEEARRRAEDANLAKSRFLATMSHELRTPLNAILGFSEVMSNEVMGPLNNEHYKEYVNDIHRSGSHLLKLINEILDLSRVEAGRYELNEEEINLAHTAQEAYQMVKLKAAEHNIQMVLQIQPDMPKIWADARAIRQVVLNLLSNALKFTPSGGTVWLKVGWTAGGGQYVAIKDTGPGIPPEEIPIVLSSFGQGSIAIKSAEQGTGLGLPIVQALVHMHDGHFDLSSKLRQGTEVLASFPRERVMSGQTPAQRQPVAPPPMAPASPQPQYHGQPSGQYSGTG